MLNLPPVGVRYEIRTGKKTLANGRVGLLDNEASFKVSDGMTLVLFTQSVGDTDLKQVATLKASNAHPVLIARVNSIKFSSATKLHPSTPPLPMPRDTIEKKGKGNEALMKEQGMPHRPLMDGNGAAVHHVLARECACIRDLTIDELAAIYPSRKKADLQPFLQPINSALTGYGIHSCLRRAHFLAQVGHESGYLRFLGEILLDDAHEQTKYNGYKGRGLIQLTGYENYKKYGDFKGIDFLGENRVKVESVEYACDSAGWFWNYGKRSPLNDLADEDDLISITMMINAGFNGFNDRAEILAQALDVLRLSSCTILSNRSEGYLPFEKSRAYDSAQTAFAWALWSDPTTKQRGLKKCEKVSKEAYARFLALNETRPIKKRRYFFESTDEMVEFAKERSK